MKRFLPLLLTPFVFLIAQLPFPGSSGGGAGGGSTVTVAAPYVTISGTKYVASTMWPFTAFFSGSFLDSVTSTLTAGTNGSELISCACNAVNSWYSIAATTSIEAEISGIVGASNAIIATDTGGIWLCDSTNGKVYSLEVIISDANASGGVTYVSLLQWTLAACSGTPSSGTGLTSYVIAPASVYHLKLSKSGGNLITQISFDAGQTYSQLDSRAVGTISKGGFDVRSGTANQTVNMTVLSSVVN